MASSDSQPQAVRSPRDRTSISVTDSLKVSESIVVSPKYLAELKRLPDDMLSFSGAVNEVSLK